MSKFRKDDGKELPPISTASLPDIVFMLLFFFMVSTTMREVTLKVRMHIPEATELSKLEKKSLVSYIYIGEPLPMYQSTFGKAPRIQLNDQFATVDEVQDFIIAEREVREEAEQPFMVTSLKIDENTRMSIVGDVKQELRKSAALNINYSSRKRAER
ncbi:biopolymer transporter ExbD [Draconibacterium sp. IB214405]|uniref:ExbD/TolR family protein n=1 Tax=Draconibacterium sp. IB214405 TaxID=3097352 RepID=UPI002A174954|nr:biopolymer transporter ExbD [Draconibacterium sp. IB214405]MDX8338546.1 biopolymer transporter ExbD [Draconibacterium sp. IB214405]